jgi:hypothetical protein
MPRYFFHTHIGDDVIVDPEGRELDDPGAGSVACLALSVAAQSVLIAPI